MQLPPLVQVATALRRTTELLAFELAAPTTAPPPWSQFEWHIARAVSAMQGVSSLLQARLRWQGPDEWQRFLSEQRQQSVGRYRQIATLLEAIDTQARREGLALVGLKGAALHAGGVYAPGERPMGDIDLLIRPGDATVIPRVLEACGYTTAFSTDRHLVFQPRDAQAAAGVSGGSTSRLEHLSIGGMSHVASIAACGGQHARPRPAPHPAA